MIKAATAYWDETKDCLTIHVKPTKKEDLTLAEGQNLLNLINVLLWKYINDGTFSTYHDDTFSITELLDLLPPELRLKMLE